MKTIIAKEKKSSSPLLINIEKIVLIMKTKKQKEKEYFIRLEGFNSAIEVIIENADIPDEIRMDFALLQI